MDLNEIMRKPEAYISNQIDMPTELQLRAKDLCWQFNQSNPSDTELRQNLAQKLFGTSSKLTFIEPTFHCDYGFNIHFHGLAIVNYNCTILDTSPVNIGDGAFIAPGVVLACAGHSIDGLERASGVVTGAPITLEKNVWIGANAVITAGVTIGDNSVIGAGSVVTKSIPENSVAVGSPCKVIRKVNSADKLFHQDKIKRS